jgi:hypothetical protein
VKRTTHLQLMPRSRNVDLYIHSHIRLHGIALNQLSTGTTLPLHLTLSRTALHIQDESGPLRQTLRSNRSHSEDHFLSSNPCSLTRRLRATRHRREDRSFRSCAPLFLAYRTGTCTQPANFESVYVYVYNVESSDDAFSSPPTLSLYR